MRLRLVSLLLLSACGDDGSAVDPDGTSSATSSTSVGSASLTTGISDSLQPSSESDGSTMDAMTTSSSSSDDGGASSSSDSSSSTGPAECRLLIVEALYDAVGADDQLQWVKLYNPCDTTFDLTMFSLGWGGADYTDTLQLDLSVSAGGCFVVGGPMASASNGDPDYEQFLDFAPDLSLAASVGGGIALFDVTADAIAADTVPIDAVVYGPNNDNGLIDQSGAAVPTPHIDNPPEGGAIRRVDFGDMWETTDAPTPSQCPPF